MKSVTQPDNTPELMAAYDNLYNHLCVCEPCKHLFENAAFDGFCNVGQPLFDIWQKVNA